MKWQFTDLILLILKHSEEDLKEGNIKHNKYVQEAKRNSDSTNRRRIFFLSKRDNKGKH